MIAVIRLGAVSYLNVRPLVEGLASQPNVRLRFDVPSECARLLAAGEIDLGMVPSITYADRPSDAIVPGVCIGSTGPVASVALFTRRPIAEVRRIALDTSSRTSACLVKILCQRRFDVAPIFVPHEPDLGAMLASADAGLLIGDAALFTDARAHNAQKLDLGALWSEMTGLPFVWAFWSGPVSGPGAGAVDLLQRAAEAGMERLDAIAAEYCADAPECIPAAREYLAENLSFRLDATALAGLHTYYREAAAAGLIASVPEIRLFAPPDAGSVSHG